MTDTLLLRLTTLEASARLEGQLLAADGTARSEVLRGTLAELVSEHPGARVVALIPAAEALSTRVRLPKISAAKLRHSLPFALEEQLAADLDGQHFALGRNQQALGADGTVVFEVPVVVIARERLARWLELLRTAGAEPSAIHLAEDCVAGKPGDVVAWIKDDQEIYLRAPTGAGAAATLDELSVVLDLLLADQPRQTTGLQVFAGVALDATAHGRIVSQVDAAAQSLARVSWVPQQDELAWLATQWRFAEPINLLQGEFAAKRSSTVIGTRWRLAAALLAAWLAIYLLGVGLGWQRTLAAERLIDTQLTQAMQVSAPGSGSVDELLRRTGGVTQERRSAALLQHALADVVTVGTAANSLKSISLEGRVLRLELSAGTTTADLASGLRARGWQVNESADDEGSRVFALQRVDEAGRP